MPKPIENLIKKITVLKLKVPTWDNISSHCSQVAKDTVQEFYRLQVADGVIFESLRGAYADSFWTSFYCIETKANVIRGNKLQRPLNGVAKEVLVDSKEPKIEATRFIRGEYRSKLIEYLIDVKNKKNS